MPVDCDFVSYPNGDCHCLRCHRRVQGCSDCSTLHANCRSPIGASGYSGASGFSGYSGFSGFGFNRPIVPTNRPVTAPVLVEIVGKETLLTNEQGNEIARRKRKSCRLRRPHP